MLSWIFGGLESLQNLHDIPLKLFNIFQSPRTKLLGRFIKIIACEAIEEISHKDMQKPFLLQFTPNETTTLHRFQFGTPAYAISYDSEELALLLKCCDDDDIQINAKVRVKLAK